MPDFVRENALIFGYIAIISLISLVVTVFDKANAIDGKRRTPERTLLLLSLLGGSAVMLITMLVIRHKTKHLKFMLGIPVIMLLQAAALFALHYFGVFA